jgi:hypothetical protein
MQIGRPRLGRTLPSSFEGTEQRCFKNLFVCTGDLEPDTWQLHAYGQLIVQHYGGDALVKSQSAAWPPGQAGRALPPPVSVLRQLGRLAASATDSGRVGQAGAEPGEEVELKIVFQKRNAKGWRGSERQLVNVAELLERCNQWRFTAPSGVRVRALCWEVRALALFLCFWCNTIGVNEQSQAARACTGDAVGYEVCRSGSPSLCTTVLLPSRWQLIP